MFSGIWMVLHVRIPSGMEEAARNLKMSGSASSSSPFTSTITSNSHMHETFHSEDRKRTASKIRAFQPFVAHLADRTQLTRLLLVKHYVELVDSGIGTIYWTEEMLVLASSPVYIFVLKFEICSVCIFNCWLSGRMREVAELILSFPEEKPVIVLSAMGKTTNKLLVAGEKAVTCGVSNVSHINELNDIKELHLKTVDELGIDIATISAHLEELELLLKGIATTKELTLRTKDYLVSFGECMSTRIFAAYLNKIGAKARQYDDFFEIGFITTDEFTNADILEATYPALAKRLHGDWIADPAIPIVTGFLGKGWKSCEITTLGRGGSDLTATTIGKALGLAEIQVWKDVDGVLTCDPNIHPLAKPVPFLTFDEAAELAYFGAQVLHPQSMRPAREGDIPVRVKNSYNPKAPGTLITKARDMSKAVLTSIVLKRNVTMLDIVSTRMLGQFGFLAKVFSIFEDLGISVDVVATSEVSISLTLDPSKLWSRELIQQELDHVVEELEKIAVVNLVQHRAILSLIGNVQRSSLLLEKVFNVLGNVGVNVQMISQGASKVNISLIVNDSEAEQSVRALHSRFFENNALPELHNGERFGNGSTGSN
ncbi:hypothetical protein H6P81_017457 [Aristolochia fimbriata]|uniref:aspartate kinase n=1 Tax=Aristolochia fimbriata TaxID=158543 RepID=A0AAV7E2I5_ARIFI|nr:hypothetical protein H6P81_017457 [Aristolochia fimbriata]